ncbi:proton-coupled amino acid transporter-like protein pathetic [Zeugodacus cucurbitae]|uniref:proton-coupled amino acid transporter-like protein pathetic n=1 Tax=Zeugodacus cucurbitae TaxID=28588 RepID=UPI0023D920B1|nr:proton-coupled amino acid transporter-like protein pathetic [Zeugodacus cucurbitae]
MGVTVEVRNGKNAKENAVDLEGDGGKKTHRTSNLETATHLFKGSVGAGLFAMGDCFKNGGLVGATVLMPILAVICVHCERMLIDGSIEVVGKTPGVDFFDYPDTVEKVFEYGPRPIRKLSKLMRTIVETFLCVTQFGFCSIYFVFITDNLHQVLQQNGIDISPTTTMAIALLPAMLPSLLTNLKYISPVSMLANCSLLFGLLATLVIALKDPMPPVSERHLVTNGTQMALFFGTALFSYEGIALILPLRNKMRNPESFMSTFGVLNVTMAVITAIFIFTGIVGYMRWGEEVEGSITLNLNPEDVMSQVVKIVAAMGVFFGYPIQFFILIKIIWKPMKESCGVAQKYPISIQVVLRFIMVLCTFGVAVVVPKLGLFISLIGALCSTSLALLIPVILDFVLRAGVPKALTTWVYLKNMAIILIAVLGIATGTYQSIVEIIKAFYD